MKNEIYDFFVMAMKVMLFVIMWTIMLCVIAALTYFLVTFFGDFIVSLILK